jgi:hypothetical protein
MNQKVLTYLACCLLFPSSLLAQSDQTYSPYTPEQLKILNSQTDTPVETPAGPIYQPGQLPVPNKPQPFMRNQESHFYNQSSGEEQAEAEETESAAPYQPKLSTFQY